MNHHIQESSSAIKLLPEHLIDQIKAGEVIERPASLVKELLENAIDSGASEIELHLIDNGMELIYCSDNGKGMSFEEIPFAFCRHATSKIERFEDLYALGTFGFRGEALASISAISRVSCTSFPKSSKKKGGKIEIHGGQTVSHLPIENRSHGTSLYIKDLFFNTPVRLKFIKSKTSEKNALKKIILSFLLSNPQVTFSIKWDEQEKDYYPSVAQDKIQQRVAQVLLKGKKKTGDDLVYVSGEYNNHFVQGFIGLSSSKGNTGKNHFLFGNQRFFFDKILHQTILRKAESFWPFGETGHYAFFINAPHDKIDVNVHPNKTHLKFFAFSEITQLIKAIIEKESIKRISKSSEEQTTYQMPRASLETRDQLLELYQGEPSQLSNIDNQAQGGLNCFSLNQDFFISKPEQEEAHLIHTFKMTQFFFSTHFKAVSNESEITPLLIAESFQLQNENFIDTNSFQSYGLEFQEIDSSLYLLKTIPKWLENLPLQQVLTPLLLSNEEEKKITPSLFEELFKRDLVFKEMRLNLNHLNDIYHAMEKRDSSFSFPMTPLSLENLFTP